MDALGAETVHTAVIGAGLAGLTCAYRLEQAGMKPTVFEGSDRVGGRVWTHHHIYDSAQYVEGGGQFINSDHTEIRELVAELALELVDLTKVEGTGGFPICTLGGRPYSRDHALEDFEGIRSTLEEHRQAIDAFRDNSPSPLVRALDDLSVTDYMKRYFPGGPDSRIGRLLRVVYQAENGAPAEEQSALNMVDFLSRQSAQDLQLLGNSDERYTIRGGCELLPDALEARLETAVRRNQRLTSIRKIRQDAYLLKFSSGLEVLAETVVLAVPFSVLRASVDMVGAGFSELKQTAIQELGMGRNTKLHMQFDRRVWADAGSSGNTFSDSGYQSTWDETRGQSGPGGILVAFAGGLDRLDASADVASQARAVLGRLEAVFPGISHAWTGNATVDYWIDFPLSRGSYSFHRPGQNLKFGRSAALAEGNCHFAGEHTSYDFAGYMNGAVASGERAARELIADSKCHGRQRPIC